MSEGLQTPTMPVSPGEASHSEVLPGRLNSMKLSEWKLVVLKFGSSVLTDSDRYQDVALEIYRWYRAGYRTIAVVSAMGTTTDALLAETRLHHRWADDGITAHLLASGECISAARLGLALDRFGIPARVLEPVGLGLKTAGPILDARCVQLESGRILDALDACPVVVVPGFVGQDELGNVTLLGRGGTDLSALFIAEALAAESCHLVKDVDGLYDLDPALHPEAASKFELANYNDVLALDEGIVQHKAVQFAMVNERPFLVRSLNHNEGTKVCSQPSLLATAGKASVPLRLAVFGEGDLLGCLKDMANRFGDFFEVVFAANPESIDLADGQSIATRWNRPQMLVDLGHGKSASQTIAALALEQGMGLLSTNSEFLAESGPSLKSLFEAQNLPFLVDAAVGGVLPVAETIARLSGTGQVRVVEALLSWPAQFVLNRILAGESLESASEEAKALGISSQALARELAGQSSLHQFLVCLNLGLALDLAPSQIGVHSLKSLAGQFKTLGNDPSWHWRYLARLDLDPNAIEVKIDVRRLNASHPLVSLPPDGIGICIYLRNGKQIVLHGRDSHPRSRILAVLGSLLSVSSP